MAINKATDFTYPASLTSTGSNVYGYITLKPFLPTNKNTIYVGYGQDNYTGSYSVNAVKYGAVTHGINIPASAFKKNNAYVVIEINTCDRNNKFVSGSYAHSIILRHPSYKNYLFNCTVPERTYPGETCTIYIEAPKDGIPNGVYCDVDILYHKDVGRQVIATKRSSGYFSFTVPAKAINSSLTVRITTRNSSTGAVIGVLPQSIKIAPPNTTTSTSSSTSYKEVPAPRIILPDNYSLTISEGENVKIVGESENINDYMIIYTKQPCDVAKAVEDYNTVSGFYAASKTDLKNKLIQNALGSTNYYVLKSFDSASTFITQDKDNKKMFHIRTPSTNDYELINDFYALQWFKNVEPGDILYIYAIQRGIRYKTVATTTKVTTTGINTSEVTYAANWYCRHCDLNNYAWWSHSSNWSPYCWLNLHPLEIFLATYSPNITYFTLTISLDRTVSYPPTIFLSKTRCRMSESSKADIYLTSLDSGSRSRYSYNIPVSYIQGLLNQGYANVCINTHWGNNPQSSAKFIDKYVTMNAYRSASSTSSTAYNTVELTGYSDNAYNNISTISKSKMTPYVVVPPAVKPVELTMKERTSKQITINYSNPLYNVKTESVTTYDQLGSMTFDVSQGKDVNDLSDLNPVKSELGEDVQIDNTLNIETNEKRLLTYEKSMPIPSNVLSTIRSANTNEIYLDFNFKSIDDKSINFKDITTNGIKVQLMLSNSGNNKTRAIDLSNTIIDYKQQEYNIKGPKLNKDFLLDNNFDTIHLLYNTDKYMNSVVFETTNWTMPIDNNRYIEKVGWRKFNDGILGSTFSSLTYDIAKHALQYDNYKIRLCLENMEAIDNIFAPPVIKVTHREIGEGENKRTETVLAPITQGAIAPGSDIYYEIPNELYNINYEDVLLYEISIENPYPINTPEITFSNAIIEVIEVENMYQVIDRYSEGFTAKIDFSYSKKSTSNTNTSSFDPVECIDVIMCCFDSNKQLINKTSSKRRDIYNGKEFIYYTDRKWHSFVGDKYINHIKYKSNYDMTFVIPENTEYMFFLAFTYSNWHDNPSIYSMSNVLTVDTIKKDLSLEFIKPEPITDEITGEVYANSDINNPFISIRVNAQKNSSLKLTNSVLDNGFNLAEDVFDRNKWIANPIIYSNTKQFGYEQPIFNTLDIYAINNVVASSEPLYNDIEYYNQWKNLYGKDLIYSPNHKDDSDPIKINSNYTIFEDKADKFIANKAIPYIEIPSELASYDRSKITIFLDVDFDAD